MNVKVLMKLLHVKWQVMSNTKADHVNVVSSQSVIFIPINYITNIIYIIIILTIMYCFREI